MGKVERHIGVVIDGDAQQLEPTHWAAPAFKHGPVAAKVPMPSRLLPRPSPSVAAAAVAPLSHSCNSVASKLHSTDTAASLSPSITDSVPDLVCVKCSAWGIACRALQQQQQQSYMTCASDEQSVYAELALEQAADMQAAVSSNAELDKSAVHVAGPSRSSVKFAATNPHDAMTCSRGVTRLHKSSSFASRCSPQARGGAKHQTLVWRPRHHR